MTIEEIKIQFPDEWVLLGNPLFNGTTLLEAVVVLHGKDKAALAQAGREVRKNYDMVKFFYTGQIRPMRRLGILKRVA